jgi:hypothetical protein
MAGWLKKLKKNVSMNNVLKGVKAVSTFVPGGALIKDGIEQGQKAVKALEKEKNPNKASIPTSKITPTNTGINTAKFSESDLTGFFENNKKMILIGVGIIAVYFLVIKKR